MAETDAGGLDPGENIDIMLHTVAAYAHSFSCSVCNMGFRIAIATVAIFASLASEIAFSVYEDRKQKQLKEAINNAQARIDEANAFYQKVYNGVKTRLDSLRQSPWELPSDVVNKLNEELKLTSGEPEKDRKYASWVLGITGDVVGVVGFVSVGLASAGIAAADGVVADTGAVLSVTEIGLTLYSGITARKKLNEAIDKVNGKQQEAEDAMAEMKNSLDGLLSSLGLEAGSYDTLKDLPLDDWGNLTSVSRPGTTNFAIGEGQSHVNVLLRDKDTSNLRDDVPALAKLIEGNISEMNAAGRIQVSIMKGQPQVEDLRTDGGRTPSVMQDVTPAILANLIEENILEMNATKKIQLSLGHQQRFKRKIP